MAEKLVRTIDPYARALEFYRPYVVARPETHRALEAKPLGLDIEPALALSPLALDSGPFVQVAYNLHGLVCGPFGMVMEKWVGYDCGFFPGVVFGFGCPAGEVHRALRAGLGVAPGYQGLVPFSVGFAIPLADRSTWLIHSLGSLNQVAPGAGPPGLNRLTLALGTSLLRAKEVLAILRWRSHLMASFVSFGPLRLRSAWTPAHDYPDTITAALAVDDAGRCRALRSWNVTHAAADAYIDADDHAAMQLLQQDIEEGVQVSITGPAVDVGTAVRHPLTFQGTPRHFVGLSDPHPEAHGGATPC